MNKAETFLVSRQPKVPVATLRLFRLAGLNSTHFLRGFDFTTYLRDAPVHPGKSSSKSQSKTLLALAKAHGGTGGYLGFDSPDNRINLRYEHPSYSWQERAGSTSLFILGHPPDIMLRALIGIPAYKITDSRPSQLFFGLRSMTIESATHIPRFLGPLKTDLEIRNRWMTLSRFIRELDKT